MILRLPALSSRLLPSFPPSHGEGRAGNAAVSGRMGGDAVAPPRLLAPRRGAVAVSGPMALSGLKLRGKDIGKPIEKGPRAK